MLRRNKTMEFPKWPLYKAAMKNKFLFSATMLFSLVSSVAAQAEVKTLILKPEAIFAPKSFDSNDNAQVVLAGAFSGYCVKMGATDFKIDTEAKKIFIRQSASVDGACMDLDMYIPYSNVLNLGTLPKGNYTVLALQPDQSYAAMTVLPIKAANNATMSGSDERLYAPVNALEFSARKSKENPTLTLKGYFTNTCLEFDTIEVYQKSPEVIEVLPLAKVVNKDCKSVVKTFSKSVKISTFSGKDTLIHVRAMNGQSLNKVITNLDWILK